MVPEVPGTSDSEFIWHTGWFEGFQGQMSEGSVGTTAKRWSWHALTWEKLWVEKTLMERRKGIDTDTRKSRFQKYMAEVASSGLHLEMPTISQLMFLWQLHFLSCLGQFLSMIQPWAHPVLSLWGSFLRAWCSPSHFQKVVQTVLSRGTFSGYFKWQSSSLSHQPHKNKLFPSRICLILCSLFIIHLSPAERLF